MNELKIGTINREQHDPLIIRNAEGEDVFRVTNNGDIYQRGRLITGDDELRQAVTAFINKMTECMQPPVKYLDDIVSNQ